MTLFNLNPSMAQQIYDAARAAGAGFPLTLMRETEGALNVNDLTAGRAKTTTTHNGYGIVERGQRRLAGSIVPIEGGVISIYAASLPAGVAPQVNDRVVIKGTTYTIERVEIDPADALYACYTP